MLTSSSAISTTVSTAAAATSSAAQTTTSTSTSTAPSTHSNSGLSSNAKIGIGLGVPLGICAAAIIAFLILRTLRHKQSSRLRHSGNIAAAGLYPARDNYDPSAGEKGAGAAVAVENGDMASNLPWKEIGELHQDPLPRVPKEVEGSPGVGRGELG